MPTIEECKNVPNKLMPNGRGCWGLRETNYGYICIIKKDRCPLRQPSVSKHRKRST